MKKTLIVLSALVGFGLAGSSFAQGGAPHQPGQAAQKMHFDPGAVKSGVILPEKTLELLKYYAVLPKEEGRFGVYKDDVLKAEIECDGKKYWLLKGNLEEVDGLLKHKRARFGNVEFSKREIEEHGPVVTIRRLK